MNILNTRNEIMVAIFLCIFYSTFGVSLVTPHDDLKANPSACVKDISNAAGSLIQAGSGIKNAIVDCPIMPKCKTDIGIISSAIGGASSQISLASQDCDSPACKADLSKISDRLRSAANIIPKAVVDCGPLGSKVACVADLFAISSEIAIAFMGIDFTDQSCK